jgi:pyruvate dehydrogenase E1 component alpha subunit
MAGLWHLPILFVCENNHYAIGTEVHRHSAVPDLYKRAAAYNIPAEKIDGMDAIKVYDATRNALDRIRRDGGPQFLDCETYRYRGHSMADPGTYRPAVELKAYQAHDPVSATIRELEFRYPSADELAAAGPDNVARLAEHMVNAGHVREVEVENIRRDVQKTVEDAVQFALNSPQPSMDAAWRALLCNRRQEALI